MRARKQSTWKRFRKNPTAMAGAAVLLLFFIIALSGYGITPDQTRNADLQAVEIQGMPPGFRQNFLRIETNTAPQPWYWPVTGKRPTNQ